MESSSTKILISRMRRALVTNTKDKPARPLGPAHRKGVDKETSKAASSKAPLTLEVFATMPTVHRFAQSLGMSRCGSVVHRRQRPLFRASTSNESVVPTNFSRTLVACTDIRQNKPTSVPESHDKYKQAKAPSKGSSFKPSPR